jgi:hypothetical protein
MTDRFEGHNRGGNDRDGVGYRGGGFGNRGPSRGEFGNNQQRGYQNRGPPQDDNMRGGGPPMNR